MNNGGNASLAAANSNNWVGNANWNGGVGVQLVQKNHHSLHHIFHAYVRKFLETSITALRPQERAGPSVAAGQGTCWRLVA
nr:MAG: hypothetical protein [Bacteriophage sp.]